jgi:serine/threonine protein kinase/WD40 repeat protein
MSDSHSSGDDLSVDRVIARFLQAEEDGLRPDPEEFVLRHPAHADSLRSFFENYRRLKTADASSPSGDSTFIPAENTLQVGSPSPPGSAAEALALHENFGRYRLEKVLGKGGMGVVYLAEDTQLHRKVALKVPVFAQAADPVLVERFQREARAAATLQHPNICPIYDVGEYNGVRFLTMAYIDGAPLSQIISRGKPIAPNKAAIAVRKLAMALQHAHERGIVHRDLKSSNVMVDKRGEPILMDFGLARFTETLLDMQMTHRGMILGTPGYMSPEHWGGDSNRIGPPADIYSLGVIFYELLTGQLPFRAPLTQLVRQILLEAPPPPSRVVHDVPPALETICLKMIAKDPAQRHASMKQVAECIEAHLRAPRTAVALSSATSATQRPLSAGADAKPSGMPSRDAHRRKTWLITGIVILALASIPIVWYAPRNRSPDAKPPPEIAADGVPDGEPAPPELPASADSAADLAPPEDEVALERDPEPTERPTDGPGVTDLPVDRPAPAPPAPGIPARNQDEEIVFLELVHELRGHERAVRSLGITADAKIGYSAGSFPDGDRTIRKWDLETGKSLGGIGWRDDFVTGIVVTPDGNLLLAGAKAGPLRLLSGDSADPLLEFPVPANATAIAQNGIAAYTIADDGNVTVYDFEKGRVQKKRLTGFSDIGTVIQLSPDESLLAAGGKGNRICVWNLKSPKQPLYDLAVRGGPVEDLQFSPDGTLLASIDAAGEITLWDAKTGQPKGLLSGHGTNTPKSKQSPARKLAGGTSLVFVQDGEYIVSAGKDETIRLWQVAAGREVARQLTIGGHIWKMAHAHGTDLLLTGGEPTSVDPDREHGTGAALYVWRLKDPLPVMDALEPAPR